MATHTTNYNLEKPEASDPFGDFRQSYNSNMDIIDANLGGGGGSGGHTILDGDGNALPQEDDLQFTGACSVSDDNVNGRTVVDVVACIKVTQAEYDALPASKLTDNIAYFVVDGESDEYKAKADKTDLASIQITGSTNDTGATITSGTYFYLNDTLVRAKTDIANGATLTLNTNYEVITAGALNDNSFFIQKTFEHSTAVSISANGYYGINIDTYVCPNGYMPIGVSLLETGNTNITIEYYDVTTTRAILRVHNTTASARNAIPKMTVTFARIKNVSTP